MGDRGIARMPAECWVSLDTWADRANCKGMDVSLFFMEVGGSLVNHPDAVLVCNRCEVQTECQEHAIKYERFGIWGGTTESVRVRIRRRRRYGLGRAERMVS
jgi:WhiB family redox-sensing transcriptional regulator